MDMDWLLDEFDELIYVSDIETHDILYMNKKCLELVGEPDAASVKGRKCYKILQGQDEPCPFCTNSVIGFDSFYHWEFNNTNLKTHFLLKDRKILWQGKPARLELAVNITKYKNELKNAEINISQIQKSIPGGICRVTEAGDILWHNDIFLDIIGYTEEQFAKELGSKSLYVHPEDMAAAVKAMKEVKRDGKPRTLESRIIRRDGGTRTLITTLNYDNSGSRPFFYSIGIDITEYKKKEERSINAVRRMLKTAENANAAKSEFLSSMSHEIRTPLNAVIGLSSMAMNMAGDAERLADCHAKIDSAARYLLSLINDILDMSKIESGKMTLSNRPFKFGDFIRDIASLFAGQMAEKGIDFTCAAPAGEEEYFSGDTLKLKQVLVNILSNAMKFTEPGGSVSMSVKIHKNEGKQPAAEFIIKDTGIGMSKSFINKAFRMFEQASSGITAKYGGSGLGLSISSHIIKLMGGSISVKSEEGSGSEFNVTVPLKPAENPDGPRTGQKKRAGRLAGKRVLVAEDNPLNAEILNAMLEMEGIKTETAANGAEALAFFKEKPAGYYYAVLMDIRMPEMDGLTAAKLIRASGREDAASLPILALSANAFDEDRRKSTLSGMNGHLIKPIDKKELLGALAEFL